MRFILSDWSDLLMTDSLLTVVHAFASRVLMSFSVDEMLFPRYVNLSTSFREPPFSVKMSPFWFWLNHMYSVLSALIWRPVPPAAFSWLCSRNSAWVRVFTRSAMSSALSATVIVCAGYRQLLKQNLALNNLKWLIYHKTRPTNQLILSPEFYVLCCKVLFMNIFQSVTLQRFMDLFLLLKDRPRNSLRNIYSLIFYKDNLVYIFCSF